ncbi:NUDIX hydrolase YfcD [Sodalis-like symbiont of Bactericera trigonica]|nr:NUDIX hydrolase YfcD [Sodalis-like symbiont of Bactericera trigonica]
MEQQSQSAGEEWVDIVNENNDVIAQASRQQMRAERLRHSASREAEEELGIADVPFAEHGLFYFENEACRVWGSLFSCVTQGPFALQESEVEAVNWLTPEEITGRCDEFPPDSLKALSLWLSRNNAQSFGKPPLAAQTSDAGAAQ